MTATIPNMIHRQIMQRLLFGEWKTLTQLGVMVGEGLLQRMNSRGWIERRGEGRNQEIKITPAGAKALAAKIPNIPQPRTTRQRVRLRTVPRSSDGV
jgi:DNA-binding PadR family transcriptional regulator